jgi:arsenate reductase
MDEIVLYHNPRCSKSRAALELLRERGAEPRVVEYLNTPPSRSELAALGRKLGLEPGRWLRRGEPAYGSAGLTEQSSEAEVLDAMATHPILIERPIAVRGDRALVGRPPERVLELL